MGETKNIKMKISKKRKNKTSDEDTYKTPKVKHPKKIHKYHQKHRPAKNEEMWIGEKIQKVKPKKKGNNSNTRFVTVVANLRKRKIGC